MFNNIIQFFIYSLVVFLSGFIIISLCFIVFTFIINLGDISILEIKDIPHDGASVHACAITITNDSASVHAGAT